MKNSSNEKTLTILTLIMVLLSIIATSFFIANGTFDNDVTLYQSQIISEETALDIAYRKIEDSFEYLYAQNVFCGPTVDRNSLDLIKADENIYVVSNDYKSIIELNKFLESNMSRDLIKEHEKTTYSYIETNGKLYCYLTKETEKTFDRKKTKIEISAITPSIIYLTAKIAYDNTFDEVSVELEKTGSNNWIITKFEKTNN